MKNLAILFFLLIFALTALGQTPKPTPKKTLKPVKTVAVKLGSETEEFEKAKAISNPAERIKAFQAFIKNFPESAEIPRAQALIVSGRAELADKKLEAGETEAGIALFKLAVQEAPTPISDELFAKVILGFPISLYSRNQRAAAFDVVKLIEEKVSANASQILDLSKFFINIQYGTEAIRLAKKSTELAPDSATGFLTLAIANRLNFQLEEAANAYAKAAELDPESVTNKRNLAEMKRALGKTDEAIAIYNQLLEKDSSDAASQNGLALALFDSGKIKEAEAEMSKALGASPNNAALLTSAAYWYAAHKDGAKAVEYSQKAIEADRNFVWAYIAQARGLLAQNKPLEAEKILLAARAYGDFPTLDYELASTRMAAGLYREAAETLKRNFVVNKEGSIETYLGNRILADANNFTELLSLERRVALFEMNAADTEENAGKLKSLLAFNQKLEAKDATEEELIQAADEFAKGDDNMRLHRQLFAASRLLQKKTALPKVLELTQEAIGGVDSALNVASPSAAVLADEIYDSRQYAISQNLVVVVPEIPRQTLSAILRGQIEDIAGRALFQQNNASQSIIRLKRALSVLPEKSVWSRATYWHLGEVLQADGKDKEAVEAYIKGYNKDLPDPDKRAFIENLYVKVNGNIDGLEEKIGIKPETTVATTETKPTPTNTDKVKITEPTRVPDAKVETSPTPKIEETPQPTPDVKPEPTPKTEEAPRTTEVKSEPTPKTEETPETKVETKTEPTPSPENIPAVTPEKTTEATPTPEITPQATPSPTPEASPSPSPEETPKTEEVKPSETKSETETKPAEVKTEPSPTPTETPVTEVKPSPTPETKPEEIKTPETKSEETKTEEKNPSETKSEPTPVPSPTPQNVSVIITDNLPQFPPSPKTNKTKTENKQNEPTLQNTSKQLFEPVIISVGKNETTNTEAAKTEKEEPKPTAEKTIEEKPTEEKSKPTEEKTIEVVQKTEPKPTEEKPAETTKKPEVIITDTLKAENKPVEKQPEDNPAASIQKPEVVITDLLKPENKKAEKLPENNPAEQPTDNKTLEKQSDERILSGELRPRIIITENTGAKTVTEEISTCKLVVNPDSLSLLNGGGSLGVSVGFDGEGDFRQITAVSSSSKDVEVRLDPDIGASQNRAFFIIKSLTTKTGVFTVTFEAPCGKKEILVKVR